MRTCSWDASSQRAAISLRSRAPWEISSHSVLSRRVCSGAGRVHQPVRPRRSAACTATSSAVIATTSTLRKCSSDIGSPALVARQYRRRTSGHVCMSRRRPQRLARLRFTAPDATPNWLAMPHCQQRALSAAAYATTMQSRAAPLSSARSSPGRSEQLLENSDL